MNCAEWQSYWQRMLDGDPPRANHADWLAHAKDCAACRELSELAERAWAALASVPAPAPSPLFTQWVVAAARRDFRRQRQRRWLVTAVAGLAAAAAIVWGVLRLFVVPRSGSELAVATAPTPVAVPAALPSLEAQLADARDATYDLTRRVARDTMRQASLFVPPLPNQSAASVVRWPTVRAGPWGEAPDPAPVEQVGQTVAHTLEPVATSTRKAFNMFRRLLPPTDLDKPNS